MTLVEIDEELRMLIGYGINEGPLAALFAKTKTIFRKRNKRFHPFCLLVCLCIC